MHICVHVRVCVCMCVSVCRSVVEMENTGATHPSSARRIAPFWTVPYNNRVIPWTSELGPALVRYGLSCFLSLCSYEDGGRLHFWMSRNPAFFESLAGIKSCRTKSPSPPHFSAHAPYITIVHIGLIKQSNTNNCRHRFGVEGFQERLVANQKVVLIL